MDSDRIRAVSEQASAGVVSIERLDPHENSALGRSLREVRRVLEAGDGRKALEMLQGADPIALMLTDLVMSGGLSGREVAARAGELKPGN